MKLTIPQLREIIHRSLKEAAAQGVTQSFYKKQMNKAIAKASKGGNKNSPPFTNKAARAGKSGLGPF